MANAKTIKIDKLNKNMVLTVSVEASKKLKIRMAIAIFLIKVAGYVMGCGVHVEK